MRWTVLLLALPLVVSLAPAAEPKKLAEIVAPFVDDSTLAVLHVDLKNLDPVALKARAEKLMPKSGFPWQPVLEGLAESRKRLGEIGIEHAFVILGSNSDPNGKPLIVLPPSAGVVEGAQKTLDELMPGFQPIQRNWVAGSPLLLKELQARKTPAAKEMLDDLTAAFTAASGSPLKVAFVLSPAQRRVIAENFPNLPKPFAEASGQLLARDFRWGVLEFGAAANGYAFKGRLETTNAKAAEQFAKLMATGFDTLAAIPDVGKVIAVDKLRKQLQGETRKDGIVFQVEDSAVVESLVPALSKIQGAANASQDTRKLRDLGLAFHTHLDGNKSRFPTTAITDNQGQPLLSWRVRLLPYLGDEAKNLHAKFKLNEPWDSDHNKKLIAEMPAIYATSQAKAVNAQGKTTIMVPVGAETIFPPGKPVALFDVTDGTSNTILALEVAPARAVPWTKPDDLQIDLKQPLAGLGVDAEGTFNVLIADGSVRRVSKTIDPKVLAAMLTRNGGEVVNWP